MNKIIMSLGLCLLMSMALVSAASVTNVETNYNKKSNVVHIEYDKVLRNECVGASTVLIFDHKDNDVIPEPIAVSYGGAITLSCIQDWTGRAIFGGRTGTFHYSKDIALTDKSEIKGLGNLRYEVTNWWNDIVLAEGKI